MSKHKILSLCLALPLIGGCSLTSTTCFNPKLNDLLVRDIYLNFRGKVIKQEQIQKDIKILLYALKYGYGGYSFHRPQIIKRVESELLKIHLGSKSLSSRKFCEKIQESLNHLPDQHLHARYNGVCRKKDKYRPVIGENLAYKKKKTWVLEYKNKIPIIAISSFAPRKSIKWDGFFKALKEAMKSNFIIIDMRGNRGGDDTWGRRMAKELYGGDYPWIESKRVKSQTPETMALMLNMEKISLFWKIKENKKIPKYMIENMRDAYKKLWAARKGLLPKEKIIKYNNSNTTFSPTKGFNKPIYVLVDKGCHSSCEGTLGALTTHPHVKVIGQNTGGTKHFGNQGLLVLPNSQVIIQMASDYIEFKDGLFIEKKGFSPDVFLQDKTDALDYVFNVLTNKKVSRTFI